MTTAQSWRKWGARGARFGIIATFAAFAAFPFYWMLITTFKERLDLINTENIPFFFNDWPTLEHLNFLFTETLYIQWLINTAIVGV
ncbi:MAG: carbohydrate ABC transporter permease, partial [Alphaproteobacteria bacterium]